MKPLFLIILLCTSASTASAEGFGSSTQRFESAAREFGSNARQGAVNTYSSGRDFAARNRDRAVSFAARTATKGAAGRLARTTIGRTGVGMVVDLAWPKVAE